jgi:WD40 repeat protein
VLTDVQVDDLDVDGAVTRAVIVAEGVVTLRSLADGSSMALDAGDRSMHGVSMSTDGSRASAVDDDGVVRVWDTADGSVVADVRTPGPAIDYAILDPRGQRILLVPGFTATGDGVQAAAWIGDVSASPDWMPIFRSSAYGEEGTRDGDAPRPEAAAAAADVARAPVPANVLPGPDPDPEGVVPMPSATPLPPAPGDQVFWGTWNPSGTRVAVAATGGQIAELDASDGTTLWSQAPHQGSVAALVYASDGRLVSTGDDRRVVVFREGRPEHVTKFHDFLYAATTTPDGTGIMATTGDGSAIIMPFDDDDLVAAVRDKVSTPPWLPKSPATD